MHFNTLTHHKTKRGFTAWAALILVIALLVQSLSICCFAAASALGADSPLGGLISGLSGGKKQLVTDEAIAQLKKQLVKSLNKDLVMKIKDYQLSGEVGVILTFSDDDLITRYNDSYRSKMTYEQFRTSAIAQRLEGEIKTNQERVLARLTEAGLVSEVRHTYVNILDGAYVRTTYEQIEKIIEIEGVERVTLSNTYEEAVAVENPVNVYDTGIFNSSDIAFTGKGTLVAVLDTGCDYAHTAFTTHAVPPSDYTRERIEKLLPSTMAYALNTTLGSGSLEAREVYYGNITNNKIVFGYDYADKDPDIMPFESTHGTHVAGIIAGKDDVITGVAVDAQLAIMKVFSDYRDGSEEGDILAALEDCIILQVDAINMSLGSASGFTREEDDEYKNELYNRIADAGISLLAAASNDYSSAYGGEQGNTNKTSNPDSGILGTPSTFTAAMSVASINGNKDKYMLANGSREVFFHESANQAGKDYDFYEMLGVKAGQRTEYEYVTVPGYGMTINYAGLDVNGKIALVRRGDINFEEKVQFAHEAGAIAIIVYNNVHGEITMTIGNKAKIPAISISKDDGEILAAQRTGTLVFDYNNQAGPFMSDFSSWGPSPDLSLKPEITAHGGNILSAVPGGGYDKLSGTSMATPNMCGITVLIRQYVKEKYPDMPAVEVRDMVNRLTMSTATIAMDRKGNPYSPRKQGAGIADILKATTTGAYLLVDGIGTTKLELRDDPTRSGVYEMKIKLVNISDESVSYRLGNITMTETVSTSDPEFVAEMGYILSNYADYSATGGVLDNGVLTVAAGETAEVSVKLTLSPADKAYINSNFENGMFVEGFLTFDNTDADGVDLNAPFLAFYGDWSEAPIFDLDYYEVETEAHDNSIDDDDKIKADYVPSKPLGTYYYDYILPLGSYPYDIDETEYPAIPATEEKAAVSYFQESISGIYGVFLGLLRAAKEIQVDVVNSTTGEVVWSDTKHDCYKAHFRGDASPYFFNMQLNMVDFQTNETFGYNNQKFEVTVSAKLDWDGPRNSNDTYTFSFYVDYQAPTVSDATFRTVYDKSRKENRYYLDMMVYDNHYAMSVRPIVVYDFIDDKGESAKSYSPLSDSPIPIYQQKIGEATKVTMEITDYLDQIRASDMSEGVTVYVDDYALNAGIYYIPFPGLDDSSLEFNEGSLDLDINATADLTTMMSFPENGIVEPEYLRSLTWTSSNPDVVAVHQGQIEARKSGSSTIRVTADGWKTKVKENGKDVEKQVYKEIVINVSETEIVNPDSSKLVMPKKLEFTSYYTIFAFNGDIDYSEIGKSNTTNYFGGSSTLAIYPSEQLRLNYTLEPWNIDPSRYTLIWSSSNSKVATVDENGVVTALKEGKARINLKIKVDGKQSLLSASCTIDVKSEFIIDSATRTLVAYKGFGGDVVIPDDEGIVTIGAFAFSHFDLDNQKEVEKDEEGNYDFDEKKAPLGNHTVTSVTIPEGVETIEKYAFYNCSVLRNVTLPESLKTVKEYAFYECKLLENINLTKVKTVSDFAFYNCASLTGSDLGGIDFSNVSALGAYSFAGTSISNADLSNLACSGIGAFKDCARLKTVILGEKTRIADGMFENTALSRITVYCDTIPDYAFRNCKKLTTVNLRGDLTYLGEEAFAGCVKLSAVNFNGICEEIAYAAFYGCTELEEIDLPNSSVVIGDAAFSETGLKRLGLSMNTRLDIVGGGVFDGVTGLTVDLENNNSYVLDGGILYNADKTVIVMAMPDAPLGDLVISAGVVEIGNGAFSSCTGLTSVRFAPDSKIEKIGNAAFAYCESLKSVILPENIVKIGDYTFYGAIRLNSINLDKVSSVGECAFQGTALTSVDLPADNVYIGMGAFYECTSLGTAVIGKGATVDAYAFFGAGLTSVQLLGNGVTVNEGAFMANARLSGFDFTKLTGRVGDLAFAQCALISTVVMPYVTEIGESCFSGCLNITVLDAAALEIIGVGAFAPYAENDASGATFATVNLPSLRVVGDYAFFGCINLQTIDLSGVEKIGDYAFAACYALASVATSEKLTAIPEGAFSDCTALKSIDISHVKRFGTAAFYGVPLPEKLNIPSAEFIDYLAFVEEEGKNYLEEVYAPSVTYIEEQAFVGCTRLVTVHAPKVEYIGYCAFGYTAIEELEISDSLREVDFSIFEGNRGFRGFFATVDGSKTDNVTLANVMLVDGALYTINEKGYTLSIYPSGKTEKQLVVADGTVRIGYTAVMENDYLEKVILPESLRSIGNFAFYDCRKLTTVVFNSYYAPVLEGSLNGEITVTPDTVENYPGFEKLYRYDYYYTGVGEVGMILYYHNFVDAVGSVGAAGLTYIIPEASERYDGLIYSAYFTASDENSGTTVGKYALAFIDAANRLPEVGTRFDKKAINTAITAYNALAIHPDELELVDEELITHFNKVRAEYNVSVAENEIDHIFDLDRSEYSFELVKGARKTFLALTSAERAEVQNAEKLYEKIDELAAVMGVEPNFDITFAEHYPSSGNGSEDNQPPAGAGDEGGNNAIVIVLIVVGSVVVLGGAGFAAYVIIRKRRGVLAGGECGSDDQN